jgi:hypothetical protein
LIDDAAIAIGGLRLSAASASEHTFSERGHLLDIKALLRGHFASPLAG